MSAVEMIVVEGVTVPRSMLSATRGYSETPCSCGQHWDLIADRCLACWAGIDPRARGLWRSVAREDRIDGRHERAHDQAEREEEREREEAEKAYTGRELTGAEINTEAA